MTRQGLSHPFSLAFAEFFVGVLHYLRREAGIVQETAESTIAICEKHGFTQFLGDAISLRGWAVAERGRHEEGIAQIQEGLAASRAPGEELVWPYGHKYPLYEAETHRLKGELLLRQDESNAPESQSCFRRAIEIARKQSAKSLELRATSSLARLLAKQGKREDARAMLAEIYGWFTEGFETADLKDAKALLDQLS